MKNIGPVLCFFPISWIFKQDVNINLSWNFCKLFLLKAQLRFLLIWAFWKMIANLEFRAIYNRKIILESFLSFPHLAILHLAFFHLLWSRSINLCTVWYFEMEFLFCVHERLQRHGIFHTKACIETVHNSMRALEAALVALKISYTLLF